MSDIDRLLHIMSRLRDPQKGCPWDREQTYRTIVPHTLEEAYEVADAIERDDLAAMRDELGDLLFQVVFYAQLAKEQQQFDFNDIVTAICDKLERRHPHVFGDVVIESSTAQTEHWEKLKAKERQGSNATTTTSILDGITPTLPAVTLAQKIQKRAARAGFDWPDYHGVFDKVTEELAELRVDWDNPARRAEEMGDLLFACVNLARHAGVDAETALREANRKFERRFRAVEQNLQAAGTPLGEATLEQMETTWQQVKQIE